MITLLTAAVDLRYRLGFFLLISNSRMVTEITSKNHSYRETNQSDQVL